MSDPRKRPEPDEAEGFPLWVLILQLIVLGPVAIVAGLVGLLRGAANFLEWLSQGRVWTRPFMAAAFAVERWYWRRWGRREP